MANAKHQRMTKWKMIRRAFLAPRAQAWVAAGGRFGVEVPFQSTLGLRVRSDIVGDLRRRTLLVGSNTDYWTAPTMATSLGIDAVVHFQ